MIKDRHENPNDRHENPDDRHENPQGGRPRHENPLSAAERSVAYRKRLKEKGSSPEGESEIQAKERVTAVHSANVTEKAEETRWKAEQELAWERLRAGDSILTERTRREYSWWLPLRCMNCGERFRLADMAEEARGSGRCGLCGKSYIRRGQEVLALGTRS
jgi:hypothetical protein